MTPFIIGAIAFVLHIIGAVYFMVAGMAIEKGNGYVTSVSLLFAACAFVAAFVLQVMP